MKNHIDNQFYLVGVSVTIYIGKDATVYNARNDDTMEKIFLCQPFVGQFLPNVVDSKKKLVRLLIKHKKIERINKDMQLILYSPANWVLHT